ncbi:hypothetical protein ABMY21_20835 [Vibrio vulnificus]|uniref:ComEC/Rec2 family competence protein n=1 Tax=Vibrio vulnificus TaxID=672 RepID=UPI00405957BC
MKVEVFNVGQGDSILIQGVQGTRFNDIPLLVDLGPQKAKVANMLKLNCYHVLLTHSHGDHIGGFPKLYRDKSIESLTLPYYLPEIMAISNFIKGKVPRQFGTLDWRKIKKIKDVNLVSHGDKLDSNIIILNPPKSPHHFFPKLLGDDAPSLDVALSILKEYGFELPVDEIINYQTPLNLTSADVDEEYEVLARTFVHRFFIGLSIRLNGNPIESAKYYATSHLKMTANQASIVFKVFDENDEHWLFTGDADESVFLRIVDDEWGFPPLFFKRAFYRYGHVLSAKYLKVPHHGSRDNLNSFILECINPEVAIISHGNRKFGRAKDRHPNSEVIDLLDVNKVRTYYTNPVIKSGKTLKHATSGIVEGGIIEFT